MKRSFILLFICLGLVLHATAQTYEDDNNMPNTPDPTSHHHNNDKIDVKQLRFGGFFAPTIAWLHPTSSTSDDNHYNVSSNGSKVGYMWGLMIEYYFADNYGIVTGFDLNVAGGKIKSTLNENVVDPTKASTVTSADFDYRLQYLEIPFALKLRSDELSSSHMKVFGQIGLTLGIDISKKASYTVDYNDENGAAQTMSANNQTLKGSLSVAPFMLEMNVGAGIEYPIATKLHFYAGLFFNNGFLPKAVNPKNYDLGYKGSFTNPNTRMNSFALRVGLFF